ncbi:DNA repair exonuclease SbcCD nuclease subunit [Haladaptatus litoreus]|uniref:DNA double-strand break repair protein Mre11 n=1 Tax=Haladaptatus litoreus TaxID=553468 RepID=A0A1N6Y5U9_9EURY|nr:DNA double-strand break repair protein Mre11 [Haladaptatus litoreus]SIR09849.1 DNA repair exonuclease SbcCD nuclease subunit [Haladaptatus litoreus]
MTRVIHTGDTHIGYRQYHSPERRNDFLSAFDSVVDDAIEDDFDAVIHAGDLFHDRRPGLSDLHGTISVLRKLERAEIPFLAIVGNHESTRGEQWLDLLETLGLATRLGAEPVVVGDTAFYGLDHVPESKRDDLEYDFSPHEQEHSALVGHGLFTPFDFGNWESEVVLSEASVDFDAMLLGDNHKPEKERVDGTWVTYCGSTERASASERDARGYNIVTFDGDVALSRRGIETRDFEFISVELKGEEGIDRIRDVVREYDLDDSVALISIEGEGGDVTAARVEEFALDEGALVTRVTDRREIEAEADELSVSFADPDDAVRSRVREMGLSETAHDVDEIVRASKVADSNVRTAVEEHVADRISEDVDAFEPASDDVEAEDEVVDESTDTETDEGEEETAESVVGATDSADTVESTTGAADDEPATDESMNGTTTTADGGESADNTGTADSADNTETTDSSEVPETTDSSSGDDQVSMEDYL